MKCIIIYQKYELIIKYIYKKNESILKKFGKLDKNLSEISLNISF